MKFFAGQCFDMGCMLTHATTEAERREGMAKFLNIPCKFGSRCHNALCMYLHPGSVQMVAGAG